MDGHDKRIQELRALLDAHGYTFGDCVNAFAANPDHPTVVAAREQYHREGELEFDDPGVVVSESDDNGDYVMCWRWVEYDKE
jgi:hypothetical protein